MRECRRPETEYRYLFRKQKKVHSWRVIKGYRGNAQPVDLGGISNRGLTTQYTEVVVCKESSN